MKKSKIVFNEKEQSTGTEQSCHIPVLLKEVINLATNNPKIIVDGTFGNGGYSKELLETFPKAKLYAFDRDETVIPQAKKFKEKYKDRFVFINDTFSTIADYVKNPDYVVLDLGLSSMQIDQAHRGFSYQNDGPLDMRMGKNEISAYEVVNEFDASDLYDIFKKYGEEPLSKMIANRIVKLRAQKPIKTTSELKTIIDQTARNGKSAARIFQAIRIFINDELGQLEEVLKTVPETLNKNGIFAVVSFHSLEDRLVKDTFNDLSKQKSVSRYAPTTKEEVKNFILLTNSAIKPSDKEISQNQRSRSARLRAIKKKEI